MPQPPNLLRNLPQKLETEAFTELLARPGVRIERIVSTGQSSPAEQYYDQAWDEWILLIEGAAALFIEGEGEYRLERGDHLLIAAHNRHRVIWTDPDGPTVWLAIHFGGAGADQVGDRPSAVC